MKQFKMKPNDRARALVHVAVKRGELVRPTACQLCGAQPGSAVHRDDDIPHPLIGAHHWRGYDYPLDVWWLCTPCNAAFKGRHDGSVTFEQAYEERSRYREMVNQPPRTWHEYLTELFGVRLP